ncbi:unnamed protein product, partial [Rotaria sp. Silwood1]
FHEKKENGQVVAVEYEFLHKADENDKKNFVCPRQIISKENFSKHQQIEITWDEFFVVLKAFILGDQCELNDIDNAFKILSKNGATIDLNKTAAFLNIVACELNHATAGVTNADVQKFILQGDPNRYLCDFLVGEYLRIQY